MKIFPLKFKTEDGYTYYILECGRVVDSLDPETEDMSWPDVDTFLKAQVSRRNT